MSDEPDELYDDPIDALAELFAVVDPEPDQHFADRLESDLRIAHAERSLARRPSRVGSRAAALATLAVVMLVAATVSLVWRDRSVSSALEMSNADGVIVTLPDGSTVDDPVDGFDLPEGTVIVVRIGGSVTIDDVSLRDGVIVTVRDGSLVTDAPITTTTVEPAERVTPESEGPAQTVPSTPDDVPRPVPVTPDPVRPAPAGPVGPIPGPPKSVPTRDLPSEPIAPRPVGPPPIAAAPPRPGDAPAPPPPNADRGVDLALAVKVDGKSGRVAVRWSAGRGLEPTWRVLVIRSIGEIQPDWPLGPATVLVGESRGAGRSDVIDEPPRDAVVANYRIVVLDGSGGVVARGAVQAARLN